MTNHFPHGRELVIRIPARRHLGVDPARDAVRVGLLLCAHAPIRPPATDRMSALKPSGAALDDGRLVVRFA